MTSLPPSLAHAIKTALPTLQGWCSVEKANTLAELVLAVPEERPPLHPCTNAVPVIVEIGVFGGRSLVPLALAAMHVQGIVYGIDPWRREANLEGVNDPANDAWWAGIDIEAIHRAAFEAIWSRGLQDYCAIIRARSETVAHLFPEESIDLLHLDGNHSELASTRDVENYLQRVRRGGIIVFDDVNWATTQKAIGMMEAECSTLHDVITHDEKSNVTGHCRVFRRN